jgi:hypothetical protein
MKTRFYLENIFWGYTRYIPGISTEKVYTWYIPGIYHEKTFWGFQMHIMHIGFGQWDEIAKSTYHVI